MKNKIIIIPLLFIFSFFISNISFSQQTPAEWATCAACHSIGKGKVIGPDLKGVTERRNEAWLISFIRSSQTVINNGDSIAVKLFGEYNKIPMPDNNFTDEQIKGLLNYIKNYDETVVTEISKTEEIVTEEGITESELKEVKTVQYGPGNTNIIFIVFGLFFLLAIFDLVITRIIKAKFIHLIIIFVSVFVIGEIVYIEAKALGRQHGYSPDQPVWFSHKVHAGNNNIDCRYCHTTVDKSKSAGIPGTGVCMNCHNVVKKGAQTGTKEIAKIIESMENKKPIEWIRVHNLPDHVWFSHEQHVNAGKRECQECHGPVEEMDRIVQTEDLSMGWCIGCHRKTEVQFMENEFYKKYARFHDKIKSGNRNRVTVEDIGGNNCQTCHY